MDLDRFIVRNSGAWRRLEELTARTRRIGQRSLAPAEVDELVALYQRTAAQLSHARTYYDDPGLTSRLTTLVAAANAAIYGSQPVSIRSVGRFFTETFPAAVYVNRRFIAASAVLFFIPMIAIGAWLGTSNRALDAAAPKFAREAIVTSEAENYYSSKPAAEFSTQVLVNNIGVSFLAFATGIFLCVGTAYFLVTNGLNIGVIGGIFFNAHQLAKFFGLILPHGLLELTAITIAGAAGLRLGWTVIAPGDRPRGEALADEGRRSVVIVLGLMLCFVVAGLIEGFVTPSALPVSVRVGIGVLVELGFIFWIVTRGRAAVDRGLTGVFGEEPRPTAVPLPSA
ncbi:MAG: hypothetical protein QOD92_1705 [Acidimicrobiaceae bacterium]|jgi:uncharacterized membrane protein SpoIIM required for sporulation